jgi:hypothetical protein
MPRYSVVTESVYYVPEGTMYYLVSDCSEINSSNPIPVPGKGDLFPKSVCSLSFQEDELVGCNMDIAMFRLPNGCHTEVCGPLYMVVSRVRIQVCPHTEPDTDECPIKRFYDADN